MKTKLYFAYGMNTNRDEMSYRCPTAVPMGKAILPGYRFEFKSFATIVPDADSSVEGVLWTITESDEQALDILEGYPEFYDKKHVKVSQGIDYIAMTYIMNPREHGFSPSDGYYGMVSEGYQQFGLSQQQLLEARSRSIQETIVYE
jgi:gamma-glutamylcyclotransferase